MNSFFQTTFSWADFLVLVFCLFILGVVLKYAARILSKTKIFASYKWQVEELSRSVVLLYEPLSFLLLTAAFIWINPSFHGLLIALFFIVVLPQLKDYWTGFFIRHDKAIVVGNRLQCIDNQGVIVDVNRLGLRMKTNQGIQFLAYGKLFSEGYIQLSGEEIGGFYRLKIAPKKEDPKVNDYKRLTDLLSTAPYLDWNHKPEIKETKSKKYKFRIRVLVKEQSHLQDLLSLIEEWGYTCFIS